MIRAGNAELLGGVPGAAADLGTPACFSDAVVDSNVFLAGVLKASRV